MKIAFVISEALCVDPYNGIRIQAQTWASELERQGHVVIYVSPWEKQYWECYDIIHLIGYSEFLTCLESIWKWNKNIVFSPIIDSKQRIFMYRLASFWGSSKLRLRSSNYVIRQARCYIAHWYVRSQFEYQYVNKAYNVPSSKITIIPLSYRITPPDNIPEKELFCLHVSKLTDSRKNVLRLALAAEKYKFRLLLAGSISSEKDFCPIREVMERCPTIRYLGRVSDEDLIDLYKKAKVFALPSINEGVGLVAVEAAACGCNIVVTNVGGPKEYYAGMAYEVNPLKIDDIGSAIIKAMTSNDCQPALRKHVVDTYSLSNCVLSMVNSYNRVKEQ